MSGVTPGNPDAVAPPQTGGREEAAAACPISRLLRVFEFLQARGSEDAEWFGDGVSALINTGTSLDSTLGLNGGHGARKARTRFLAMQRAAALREAWYLCDGATPWLKSVSLAEQVRGYESQIWPRHRALEHPPEGSSRLRVALFKAFKTGLTIPRTAVGIDRATKRMGASSFADDVENETCENPSK